MGIDSAQTNITHADKWHGSTGQVTSIALSILFDVTCKNVQQMARHDAIF
jgi:hypothetical protein